MVVHAFVPCNWRLNILSLMVIRTLDSIAFNCSWDKRYCEMKISHSSRVEDSLNNRGKDKEGSSCLLFHVLPSSCPSSSFQGMQVLHEKRTLSLKQTHDFHVEIPVFSVWVTCLPSFSFTSSTVFSTGFWCWLTLKSRGRHVFHVLLQTCLFSPMKSQSSFLCLVLQAIPPVTLTVSLTGRRAGQERRKNRYLSNPTLLSNPSLHV